MVELSQIHFQTHCFPGTHWWAAGSTQAWVSGGSWRSWRSLRSRLALLRDPELQPAVLEKASPTLAMPTQQPQTYTANTAAGVAGKKVSWGVRQAVIMLECEGSFLTLRTQTCVKIF